MLQKETTLERALRLIVFGSISLMACGYLAMALALLAVHAGVL